MSQILNGSTKGEAKLKIAFQLQTWQNNQLIDPPINRHFT